MIDRWKAPSMAAWKGAVIAAFVVSGCGGESQATRDSATPSADSVSAAAVAASPVATSAEPKPPAVPERSSDRTPQPTRPHLAELLPASGPVASVIIVKVRGDRFTPAGNTVYFGAVMLDGVAASADGKVLTFTVPQTLPSRGEAPPRSVPAGTYGVYVVNSNGTSDTLSFALKEPSS